MTDIDEAKLERSLKDTYGPGQLQFCHDAGYRLRWRDHSLCSLSEEELQRCPAFKKQCAVSAFATQEPSSELGHATVPNWMGTMATVMFWGLMAGLLIALCAALIRMFDNQRPTSRVAEEAPDLEPQGAATPEPAPSGDTDVERLLDKARRAADRGELGLAIDAAHAAAVQGLGSAGQLEVHRDRTNGDYVRELRKDPPLQQQFKLLVRDVEVAQFGGRAPTRSNFDQVLVHVLGLLRRLAVLTLLMLVVPGCHSASGSEREPEDKAPHGLFALKRLLTEQGRKLHVRVTPLGKIDETIGTLIVYDTVLEDQPRQHLLDWVAAGGYAVLVGRDPELERAAELEVRAGGCGHDALRSGVGGKQPLTLRVLGESSLRIAPAQQPQATHLVDASCGGVPYVATAFLGEGALTVIPERELLSNASLSVADNARFVLEQVGSGSQLVELVGPWTGDGAQSPLHSIKNAGLLPVLLQLLLLFALLAIRQGTSFGARRQTETMQRRAFADHVRAVAASYARAGAASLASAHYGLLLIEQLKERVCLGQKPSLLQLAAALARRTGRSEPQVVSVLVDAKSAFDEHETGKTIPNEIIRELEKLSLQAGGAR